MTALLLIVAFLAGALVLSLAVEARRARPEPPETLYWDSSTSAADASYRPSCKIPRYIRFATEFPTTVTGKIQRFRMREISIAELGLSGADAVRTA